MVKAYTHEHVYKHPWERVTSAFWRKFTEPENKAVLSHIIEVDTLCRTLDPSSGVLFTTRAITVHAPGPRFLSRLIGQDFCHCVETSHVDPSARSMVSTTRNLSLRKFLEVEEKSSYHPHPANPDWTVVRQTTSIRCSPVSAVAAMAEKIEQRCAERFQQNSAKGRDVMERIFQPFPLLILHTSEDSRIHLAWEGDIGKLDQLKAKLREAQNYKVTLFFLSKLEAETGEINPTLPSQMSHQNKAEHFVLRSFTEG